MKSMRMLFAVFLVLGLGGITQAWTFTPAKLEGKIVGGSYDPAGKSPGVVYPSFLSSPGESIDFTFYDQQHNCTISRMIALDGVANGGVHVCYTKSANAQHNPRNIFYQFNDRTGGGWFGGPLPGTREGYVTLGVFSDGRAGLAWNGGSPATSRVGIDAARGSGAFTITNLDTGPIWPHIGVGPTGVVHVVAHHQVFADNYYSRNLGSWVRIAGDTMQGAISADVFVSRLSGKVAIAWCRARPTSPHNQINTDIVYIESTDHGVTWGPKINVTNYQASDTVRAYCDVSGIYDNSDNLHLSWSGERVLNDSTYYNASAIFHWSQATGIDLVSGMVPPWAKWPGTFWWDQDSAMGTWKLGADRPSLSIDAQGRLYCVWTGQIIPNDISQGGFPNGDLYGRGSVDGGNTWGAFGRTDTMIYITNSHTPGAPPGACDDDDYPSITKFTTDSVRILFIEDKDAGSSVQSEGSTTCNPVKYLAVKADWFWPPTGIETAGGKSSGWTIKPLTVQPNPFASFARVHGREGENFELYDISGRRIGTYRGNRIGHDLGPGVYFLKFEHGQAKPFRIVKVK